ncbi:MAG TPA: hypothetical protein DEP19_06345 [Anaerolineae bacterium]|nr:hypothetical protein [Anaerolineae bacterium]HCK66602.1 hypothetical protein [Anaerolineae bacterium]
MPKRDDFSYQEIYEEVGRTYRYFLSWRHALLGGYLIGIYTLFSHYFENNDMNIQRNLLICLFVITIVFWMIEYRIRELYRACTNSGAKIETDNKFSSIGIYVKLDSKDMRGRIISHSNAFNILFLSVLLAVIYLSFKL